MLGNRPLSRGMKGGKSANKLNADYTVIIGEKRISRR